MTKKKNRHFLEAFLEGSEAAIDLATDNEAVKAVPVIGTALRILHGVDDLRSRAFAAKLHKFIQSPELRTDKARAKLKEGIASSPEEAERIGETLFLVLERMTDLDKPAMLAKVFAAFLDDRIDATTLRRIAHAVDSAFTDDLAKLSRWNADIHPSYAIEWMRPLSGSGITHAIAGRVFNDVGETGYELTEMGKTLHAILTDASSE